MEQQTEKTEIRLKKDGSPMSPNNGGRREGSGRKISIEKVREELRKELDAEFWVNLAKDKAIPGLLAQMDSENEELAWKARKEVLDRALGKPKESVDLTSKGKAVGQTVIRIIKPHEKLD